MINFRKQFLTLTSLNIINGIYIFRPLVICFFFEKRLPLVILFDTNVKTISLELLFYGEFFFIARLKKIEKVLSNINNNRFQNWNTLKKNWNTLFITVEIHWIKIHFTHNLWNLD